MLGAAGCRRGWLVPRTSAAVPLPSPPAMSSYLYIIKSELPLVIQTFLNLENPSP